MRAALIDLDGTVYRSEEPIPGAPEGIATLQRAGIDLAFVSNTSSTSRETCQKRLEGFGIETDVRDILTSASVIATSVAETYPGATVFAIGQPALFDELEASNVEVTDDPDAAELVVMGKDRSFDFGTLTRGLRALGRDVPFMVTNRDRTTPTSDGIEPGTGAIVGAVAIAAEREPDVVAGKPNDPMIDATLDRLDVPPADCLVVGDSLESDIVMGKRAGMTTVLVLSGIEDRDSVEGASIEPDYVVESMARLDRILDLEEGV